MKPIRILQPEETPVLKKTRELCQTILDMPAYRKIKEDILAFLGNERAVHQYQDLCDQQDALDTKQEQGGALTDEEHGRFAQLEAEFLKNPQAAAFISAQRQMHDMEETIQQYVRKTFELGRVPSEGDFSSCGCGSGGCGSH